MTILMDGTTIDCYGPGYECRNPNGEVHDPMDATELKPIEEECHCPGDWGQYPDRFSCPENFYLISKTIEHTCFDGKAIECPGPNWHCTNDAGEFADAKHASDFQDDIIDKLKNEFENRDEETNKPAPAPASKKKKQKSCSKFKRKKCGKKARCSWDKKNKTCASAKANKASSSSKAGKASTVLGAATPVEDDFDFCADFKVKACMKDKGCKWNKASKTCATKSEDTCAQNKNFKKCKAAGSCKWKPATKTCFGK